ncbi:hypothetical protein C8R43DRAFT_1003195 [Mycena crocata]|nr:hypothetical protein C8R43DRAFT_1003195 [Mycena crocata]
MTFGNPFDYSTVSPGEERMRLWHMEKKPDIALKLNDIKRDKNAELGRQVREICRQRPNDYQAVVNLCREAEEAEATLEKLLQEGIDAEAERVKTAFVNIVLNHPGESDPTEELRHRIRGSPDSAASSLSYCSPVLMETLFWEGMDQLPNAHRKRMELDFPHRVEALLDFHCIAFHADIEVLKELYNEDIVENKDKRKEVLKRHGEKMEHLMATSAEKMRKDWADAKERLRSMSPQISLASSNGLTGVNDSVSPRPTNDGKGGMRRHAHMTDPPTILKATERKPKTAHSPPLRGILKTAPAASGLGNIPAGSFAGVESAFLDDTSDEGESFFLKEMIMEAGTIEPEVGATFLGPEIVEATPNHRRYSSTSQTLCWEQHPGLLAMPRHV